MQSTIILEPSDKKFLVYKTTNLINNMIYIGVHVCHENCRKKTNDKNCRYLGSGSYFKQAVKKYGENNFKREILFTFNNQEEMLLKEKEIVNEEFIERKDTYNVIIGGGKLNTLSVATKEETKRKISASNTGKKRTEEQIKKQIDRQTGKKNKPCSEETKNKISEAKKGKKIKLTHSEDFKEKIKQIGIKNKGKKRTAIEKENISKKSKEWFLNATKEQKENRSKKISDSKIGISRSKECIQKIKQFYKVNTHHAKNSFWITNGTEEKMIKSTEKIPKNWKRGQMLYKKKT